MYEEVISHMKKIGIELREKIEKILTNDNKLIPLFLLSRIFSFVSSKDKSIEILLKNLICSCSVLKSK